MSVTWTAHFAGSGRFQALTPSREHTLKSMLPMSNQTLGWARGGAGKYCVTDPGTAVDVNTDVHTYATAPTECLIGHGERGKYAL